MRDRIGLQLFAIAVCMTLGGSGCEDNKFHGASPAVEHYHHGPVEQTPSLEDFSALPDSGEIEIDFGRVDVSTVHRRYLFVRNEGLGDLLVHAVSELGGPSSAFFVACREGGSYRAGCPYNIDQPLSIAPGRDFAIELTYSPAVVGVDSAGYLIKFNTTDHQELTLRLAGESITREIQVCVSDCEDSEDSLACQQAEQLCNDETEKDLLPLAFGDTPANTTAERQVLIRNLGERALQVSALELVTGSAAVFDLDLQGSDLPGELPALSEVTVTVIYSPEAGMDHLGRLRIASDDVNEPEVEIELSGQGVAPRVCPDPGHLDFGNVVTGEPSLRAFALENCGTLPLQLFDVDMALDPASPDFSLVDTSGFPVDLAVGESVSVEVQYLPLTAGSDAGGVDIFSDDLAADPVSHHTGMVSLFGRAVSQVCDLQINPVAASFGPVEIGQEASQDLTLTNLGNGSCTLSDIGITINSAAVEFELVAAPAAGAVIDAGNNQTVTLRYQPTDLGQDIGILSIFANDRDTDEIRVDLNGFGIPPGGNGPVAICSVNPVNPLPMQTIQWQGDASYDTNNRAIVDYQWRILSFPAGSAAALWGTGANRSSQVDLAGAYTAELIVENDLGQQSPPCTATATLVPTQDLWVEMYWTERNDDMDLHLLAPNGIPRTRTDCYFGNCRLRYFVPDWGQINYDGDDPHLDFDDIPGDGPENINIADPADGTYTVFVHDYPGNSYEPGNLVTVNVYINGALISTFTETVVGEDQDWYVCEIDWPSGNVRPL